MYGYTDIQMYRYTDIQMYRYTLFAPQIAGKICFLAGVSLRVVLGNFLIQIVSLGL